jgi:hypothetical protein
MRGHTVPIPSQTAGEQVEIDDAHFPRRLLTGFLELAARLLYTFPSVSLNLFPPGAAHSNNPCPAKSGAAAESVRTHYPAVFQAVLKPIQRRPKFKE